MCKIEQIGKCDYAWYCCNCGDGPMTWACNTHCSGCNVHFRCNSDATPITPCETPPAYDCLVTATPVEEAARLEIQASPCISERPTSIICLADEHLSHINAPEKSTVPIQGAASHTSDCISPETSPYLGSTVEQGARTVVNFLFTLPSTTERTSVSGDTERPSGKPSSSPRGTKGSVSASLNLVTNTRRQRCKEGSVNQGEGKGSSEAPGEQKTAVKRKGSSNSTSRPFACPFFKNYPHRYRHIQSCQGPGWTDISRLKEHLKDRAHKLLECEVCLRVFAKKDLNAGQIPAHRCVQRSQYYPVEGVGPRLCGLLSQKRGPKGDSASISEEEQWNDIYRTLFGGNAVVPSCYYDEDDIARSNRLDLQEHYRERLIQSLRRLLPEPHLLKVVQFHLDSVVIAEVQAIVQKLGLEGELDTARTVLAGPWAVKSRRTFQGKGLQEPDISDQIPELLGQLSRSLPSIGTSSFVEPDAENDHDQGGTALVQQSYAPDFFGDAYTSNNASSPAQLYAQYGNVSEGPPQYVDPSALEHFSPSAYQNVNVLHQGFPASDATLYEPNVPSNVFLPPVSYPNDNPVPLPVEPSRAPRGNGAPADLLGELPPSKRPKMDERRELYQTAFRNAMRLDSEAPHSTLSDASSSNYSMTNSDPLDPRFIPTYTPMDDDSNTPIYGDLGTLLGDASLASQWDQMEKFWDT